MKTIDMRFDTKLLESFVGKPFVKYRCDDFVYTNSVTQIVGLFIGSQVYKLSNEQQMVDYYGNEEDIAVFSIEETVDTEIKSAFIEVDQRDTPIGDTIIGIKLVNENQQVFENGAQTYNVWLTRGIILEVGNRQVSFEKQNVPFSEEIIIRRGYDLIDTYGDIKGFSEDWPDGIKAVATREIVEI